MGRNWLSARRILFIKKYLKQPRGNAVFARPHPPPPSPYGEGAVQQIFVQLYNYPIIFRSLISIFEASEIIYVCERVKLHFRLLKCPKNFAMPVQ